MPKAVPTPAITEQAQRMQQYYRLQARIYDATRWSFLFGRKNLAKTIPRATGLSGPVVEVGCGTGHNLPLLARRFPDAKIIGLDVSADMLRRAKSRVKAHSGRVTLRKEAFDGNTAFRLAPQLFLFAYSLSMMNPQWEDLLAAARRQLAPGGHIAVVDFHDTPHAWFRAHMANHHVRMEGHLLPALETCFQTTHCHLGRAYGGIWRYVQYVGRKG